MDYDQTAQKLLEKKLTIDTALPGRCCVDSSRWVATTICTATVRDLYHLQAALEGVMNQVHTRACAGALHASVSSVVLKTLHSLHLMVTEQLVVRMLQGTPYGTA